MALFSRGKQREVGQTLNFDSLANIADQDEEEEIRQELGKSGKVSLFSKENIRPRRDVRIAPEKSNVKPQPRQAKLTERKVETFTAPQNIEHDTQEPSKTTATSIITTTKKEEYQDQGHDFKDLYEESNLMTEDKRDFENNPLGNNRSNDKKGTAIAFSSAPPAEILSNTQTESIPLSSPRYEIERVSVAKSMSLDTYATTRTQQQKSYPADLRFATSRTTSSFAANNSSGTAHTARSVDAFDMNTVSKSIDTWDDEAYSAAASAAVSTEDDEDRFGSVDDYEDNPIDTLFSKVRHNRTDYVLGELRSGFNPNAKDRNGNTIIHICAQNNHRKLASKVLQLCPPGSVWINAENKKFCTPLDFCEKYGFTSMAEWLISKGGTRGNSRPAATHMR